MSVNIDIEHLKTWIGNQESEDDVVTPELVRRFTASLANLPEGSAHSHLPLGLHWCLAQPSFKETDLGVDGHPSKGGFLPPVSLPQRMWASSHIIFHKALEVGVFTKKTSTIKNVILKKNAAASPLIFVEINHDYEQNSNLCIQDKQTLVYRESSPYKKLKPEHVEDSTYAYKVVPTSVLLFRYSALTFNSHRIHYDTRYCKKIEGYPGLVVHGPLMATMLMNLAQAKNSAPLKEFKFRALAPSFVDENLNLILQNDEARELEVRSDDGSIIMSAQAEF